MTAKTVLGPAGAPMRAPWGSFAGKPPAGGGRSYTQQFTALGPAGAPMHTPYNTALFATKVPTKGGGPGEWLIRARRRNTR